MKGKETTQAGFTPWSTEQVARVKLSNIQVTMSNEPQVRGWSNGSS